MNWRVFIGLIVATALAVASCTTPPPPEPPTPPIPTPTPEPTPEYELWMGPRPTAAPTLPVGSETIAPPLDENGEAVARQPRLSEDSPGAMLAAHAILLKRRGRAPLNWSEELSQRARSIAIQLSLDKGPYSYCARNYSVNYTGPNEALHIAAPVLTEAGLRREGGVNVRELASQWAQEQIGVFDPINRRSTRMGCARAICPQSSEIWVCRFE